MARGAGDHLVLLHLAHDADLSQRGGRHARGRPAAGDSGRRLPRRGPAPPRRVGAAVSSRLQRRDPRQRLECGRADRLRERRSEPRCAPVAGPLSEDARARQGQMRVGDEWVVRMPGPWDGPVRTIEVGPEHFRFATLAGHLEAGQIEWRADGTTTGCCAFRSSPGRGRGTGSRRSCTTGCGWRRRCSCTCGARWWRRSSDLAGGRLERGIEIETRRVDGDAFD